MFSNPVGTLFCENISVFLNNSKESLNLKGVFYQKNQWYSLYLQTIQEILISYLPSLTCSPHCFTKLECRKNLVFGAALRTSVGVGGRHPTVASGTGRKQKQKEAAAAVLVSAGTGAIGEGQALSQPPCTMWLLLPPPPAPRCPPKTWQCITSASGAMNSVVFLVFWRCDWGVSSEHIRIW